MLGQKKEIPCFRVGMTLAYVTGPSHTVTPDPDQESTYPSLVMI